MSEFFVNDKYRVLECMANRQIPVNNEEYTSFVTSAIPMAITGGNRENPLA